MTTKKISFLDMYKDKLRYQFINDDKYERILILDNKKFTFNVVLSVETDEKNLKIGGRK